MKVRETHVDVETESESLDEISSLLDLSNVLGVLGSLEGKEPKKRKGEGRKKRSAQL